MKRLTDIEADIEELTKSPTTLPPPPSPTTPSIPGTLHKTILEYLKIFDSKAFDVVKI